MKTIRFGLELLDVRLVVYGLERSRFGTERFGTERNGTELLIYACAYSSIILHLLVRINFTF